ncbi:hypothetical protein [Micromonospora eburnea]|uniref:Uncharacterized protein n=1 Tax=Micromonospora eburnea TaxID=227316 RepID=A0A1C6ULK7_9ACTN|nr:hypothetical protein [Micromonospora eburnea]SCL54900.1 hypothetical protein GA0070604_3094 [Micromonospora eburnea]
MQAKPSAVATNPRASRWPGEWARREDDRRQRAYDARLRTWRRHEEHLVRLRIEATAFVGCAQPRAGLPAELDHDEVVYRVLPAAELIEAEARHLTGLPAPGLTVAADTVDEPGRVLPAGLRVVDAGMAVVTDRRVAFAGRHGRREWTYRGMLGPGHHPEVPITLLHTADGRRPAGLRIPAAAAVNARFYLTLAFATAAGSRAAVVAQVDALLAAHRDARPAPPAPAEPHHAPFPVPRPERMAAAAAVVVAVALAALATGTLRAEPAELPYGAEAGAGGIAATADVGWTIGDPVPSPPAVPGPGGSPTRRPPVTTPVARTTGGAATGGEPVTGPVTRRSAATATRATGTGTGTGTGTAPAPAPAPTTRPEPAATLTPTTGPAPTTAPAPTAAPAPTPSTGFPVRDDCPGLLHLPLVNLLLCPAADR